MFLIEWGNSRCGIAHGHVQVNCYCSPEPVLGQKPSSSCSREITEQQGVGLGLPRCAPRNRFHVSFHLPFPSPFQGEMTEGSGRRTGYTA